ncbi:hypothetical protein B5181_10860 [Streptomyces sp. 4F]|nr:hypothetical protein B5181_10860 [Streptomyces sp. 4F]
MRADGSAFSTCFWARETCSATEASTWQAASRTAIRSSSRPVARSAAASEPSESSRFFSATSGSSRCSYRKPSSRMHAAHFRSADFTRGWSSVSFTTVLRRCCTAWWSRSQEAPYSARLAAVTQESVGTDTVGPPGSSISSRGPSAAPLSAPSHARRSRSVSAETRWAFGSTGGFLSLSTVRP